MPVVLHILVNKLQRHPSFKNASLRKDLRPLEAPSKRQMASKPVLFSTIPIFSILVKLLLFVTKASFLNTGTFLLVLLQSYLIVDPDLCPGCIVLIMLMKQLMLKDGDQIARTLGKDCATTPKTGLNNILGDSA